MGTSKQSTYSHMDIYTRTQIQEMLNNGDSVSKIAGILGKSVSTIKREIERNAKVMPRSGNDCLNKKLCYERKACNAACNKKLCKHCKSVDCCLKCTDYVPSYCDRLLKSPHVCNGCDKIYQCVYERHLYRAPDADRLYKAKQHDRSEGFNMTESEVKRIDKLISPLLKNGMSPHAALQTVKSKVKIGESTLYRMIDTGLIKARNIDLPEKVSRRPTKLRKRKSKDAYAVLTTEKLGHMYSDYLEYTAKHSVFTVEMDSVEGKKTDKAAILSLHWRDPHMQLYFMLDVHDPGHVVEMLDRIEISLDSLALFRKCFPLILTDNGQEFTDIKGMGRSVLEPGKQRTHIFFCEPNRSDQKGSAERNHRLLRRIVRKGTSVQSFTQFEMSLATNHVNSYVRKKIGDICPYDRAVKILPEDFFLLLGLEKIPPDQIILKPSLIGIEEKPLAYIS